MNLIKTLSSELEFIKDTLIIAATALNNKDENVNDHVASMLIQCAKKLCIYIDDLEEYESDIERGAR